jgi:hypothetical protein
MEHIRMGRYEPELVGERFELGPNLGEAVAMRKGDWIDVGVDWLEMPDMGSGRT